MAFYESPFEILGISREKVKELKSNDEILHKVVDSLYQTYAIIYHPDRHHTVTEKDNAREKFQKITEANSLLKDEQFFAEEKENYASKGSMRAYKGKIEGMSNDKNILLKNLGSFVKSQENPKNIVINLYEHSNPARKEKRIEFDKDGRGAEISDKKSTYNRKILGAIPPEIEEKLFIPKRKLNELKAPYWERVNNVPVAIKAFSEEQFKEILPFVTPNIAEGNYLISFDNGIYCVEGRIKDVHKRRGLEKIKNLSNETANLVAFMHTENRGELIKIAENARQKGNLDLELIALIESGNDKMLESYADRIKEKNPVYAALAYYKAFNEDKILNLIDELAEKKKTDLAFSLCDIINAEEKKGDIMAMNGDYKGAVRIYGGLKKWDYDKMKTKLFSIGNMVVKKGKIWAFKFSTSLFKEIGEKEKIVDIGNMAKEEYICLKKSGKNDKAKNLYLVAHDAYEAASADKEMGDLYFESGELEDAYKRYSFTLREGYNKRKAERQDFEKLGDKAIKLKKFEEALKYYGRANATKKIGDIMEIALKNRDIGLMITAYSKTNTKKQLEMVWPELLKSRKIMSGIQIYNFLHPSENKYRYGGPKVGGKGIESNLFIMLKKYKEKKGLEELLELAEWFEEKGQLNYLIKAYEAANMWKKVGEIYFQRAEKKEETEKRMHNYNSACDAFGNALSKGEDVKEQIKEVGDAALRDGVLTVALKAYAKLNLKNNITRVFDEAVKNGSKDVASDCAILLDDAKRIEMAKKLPRKRNPHKEKFNYKIEN